MERHREALLWSYIMLRSDADDDGYLSWPERRRILRDIEEGMGNGPPQIFAVASSIALDGPAVIRDLNCDAFDTENCLAPGFSIESVDANARVPAFSSAAIFDRVARQTPRCGDCLLKLVLNRRRSGLGPLLPHPIKKPPQRAIVIKAVMRYQYVIVQPDASFHMITDAEQVEHALINPYVKNNKMFGQLCLNDDVVTRDDGN
ncbi:hypothetical protein EK21DRAFT_94829 [Setomelanomma holmii]|uniref:Uncharacterized protein n=1 Tax=Setomelanomma holmii TaxID=210430 RepID=A0A9P4GVM4_9PLEO|nr:hypothetical protein EK21DRAFT_94829 [Setomelanomma holmii]